MPGSEAMARQFVHGKRFFLDEFGIENDEAWLPDTFGFAAGLPQIIKAAGSKWLLTQKISWSRVNSFPHHTFAWEGIDGTRIFTHFPPVDSYNCEMAGRQIAHAARNFKEKGGGPMRGWRRNWRKSSPRRCGHSPVTARAPASWSSTRPRTTAGAFRPVARPRRVRLPSRLRPYAMGEATSWTTACSGSRSTG